MSDLNKNELKNVTLKGAHNVKKVPVIINAEVVEQDKLDSTPNVIFEEKE